MKKSLHLALSKYNPVPRSLQEASTGKAKTAVDVDLAGLYHHYYLDTYGVEPPSPDPAQFEHLRFLMPCGDFRFQGDGLGASTNARRSKSTELGQAFCRWFMHEHLGIKYFAHIGNLIGPHSAKFHGFAVKRILPGDMPDYLCSAGPGSVMVAEAKGRYTSVSFKNAEFETWRQQFTRGAYRIRKKSYYKGFPIEHKPNSCCLTQLHMPDRRKKVKDCGTTNGHLELIARTLMKDAREGLVR